MNNQNPFRGIIHLKMNYFRLFLFLLTLVGGLAGSGLGQGVLDPNFGNRGAVLVSTPTSAMGSREADSVLQSNGKIVSLMNASGSSTCSSTFKAPTLSKWLSGNGNRFPS